MKDKQQIELNEKLDTLLEYIERRLDDEDMSFFEDMFPKADNLMDLNEKSLLFVVEKVIEKDMKTLKEILK